MSSMEQEPPTTIPGDNAFYLLWRQPPGLQREEKETVFLSEGSICLVQPFAAWAFLSVKMYYILKRQLNTSGVKNVLNFLFFYYCELHYGYSTPLLDLETRGMMIIWP